jgi:hypothetical protein
LELVAGKSIHLAEYGSSQGGNSVAPFAVALGVVGELCDTVQITHTDLVSNDWNALLRVLDPQNDASSYARELKSKCFVSARTGSFHTALFPPGSIHLGWSSIANHWLSAVPDGVASPHSMILDYRHPLVKAQAHADWVAYLQQRERELVRGGQLVNVEILRPEHGFQTSDTSKYVKFCDVALQLLHARFGPNEVFTFPMLVRSKAEMVRPFESRETGQLVLKDAQTIALRDVFKTEFHQTGNAQKYAQDVVRAFRAVATSLQLAQRFPQHEVELFYEDLTALVASTAPELTFGVLDVCVLRMVKKGG